MSYDVNVDIRKFGNIRQTAQDTIGVDTHNEFDANRQYTHLVPGAVTINAKGTAVVDLENSSLFEFNTNYDVSGYQYLSKQDPGEINIFKQKLVSLINGNQFEIFFNNGINARYVPFFRQPGSMGIEITSSYLKSLSLTAPIGTIKVDFDCELQGRLAMF
jgi:hypothetical protein